MVNQANLVFREMLGLWVHLEKMGFTEKKDLRVNEEMQEFLDFLVPEVHQVFLVVQDHLVLRDHQEFQVKLA